MEIKRPKISQSQSGRPMGQEGLIKVSYGNIGVSQGNPGLGK